MFRPMDRWNDRFGLIVSHTSIHRGTGELHHLRPGHQHVDRNHLQREEIKILHGSIEPGGRWRRFMSFSYASPYYSSRRRGVCMCVCVCVLGEA